MKKADEILGLRLWPDDAYLITRGLRTLDIRLDKHESNAKKVCEFLSKSEKVKLLYPYKKSSFNFINVLLWFLFFFTRKNHFRYN